MVVESRVHEEQGDASAGSPAARILGLCIGDLYSEVAVFRQSSGELELMNPVYWTGASIVQVAIGDDGIGEVHLGAERETPVC